MRSGTSPAIHDDPLEPELMSTLGVHVGDSAKIIFNIKQSLYELVKLNVSATIPSRKYDTAPAIISGSKRNLDDLRRIQSILKGYINTLKTQSEQSQEQSQIKHLPSVNNSYLLKNLKNLTIDIDQKSGGGISTKSSPKNIIDTTVEVNKMQGSNKRNQLSFNDKDTKSRNSQIGLTVEIDNLRKENSLLKNQVEKLIEEKRRNRNQSPQPKKNYSLNSRNMPRQFSNDKMPQNESEIKDSKIDQNKGVPLLAIDSMYKESPKDKGISQNEKNNKMKRYSSTLFATGRSLHDIRNRNKQCLQLIRSIKKQIGLQNASK